MTTFSSFRRITFQQKKTLIMKINEIINNAWKHFGQFRRESFIVPNSIPILWFGDMERYLKSEVKIVTLALNPSSHEFPVGAGKERFDLSIVKQLLKQEHLDEDKYELYKSILNNYFKLNPLYRWFNNFRATLAMVDASYGAWRSWEDAPNRAIHIDLMTPLATNPVWSKLSTCQKEQLMHDGHQICKQLLYILKPDFVLVSVGNSHLERLIQWSNVAQSYSWGKEYFSDQFGKTRFLNIKFRNRRPCGLTKDEIQDFKDFIKETHFLNKNKRI